MQTKELNLATSNFNDPLKIIFGHVLFDNVLTLPEAYRAIKLVCRFFKSNLESFLPRNVWLQKIVGCAAELQIDLSRMQIIVHENGAIDSSLTDEAVIKLGLVVNVLYGIHSLVQRIDFEPDDLLDELPDDLLAAQTQLKRFVIDLTMHPEIALCVTKLSFKMMTFKVMKDKLWLNSTVDMCQRLYQNGEARAYSIIFQAWEDYAPPDFSFQTNSVDAYLLNLCKYRYNRLEVARRYIQFLSPAQPDPSFDLDGILTGLDHGVNSHFVRFFSYALAKDFNKAKQLFRLAVTEDCLTILLGIMVVHSNKTTERLYSKIVHQLLHLADDLDSFKFLMQSGYTPKQIYIVILASGTNPLALRNLRAKKALIDQFISRIVIVPGLVIKEEVMLLNPFDLFLLVENPNQREVKEIADPASLRASLKYYQPVQESIYQMSIEGNMRGQIAVPGFEGLCERVRSETNSSYWVYSMKFPAKAFLMSLIASPANFKDPNVFQKIHDLDDAIVVKVIKFIFNEYHSITASKNCSYLAKHSENTLKFIDWLQVALSTNDPIDKMMIQFFAPQLDIEKYLALNPNSKKVFYAFCSIGKGSLEAPLHVAYRLPARAAGYILQLIPSLSRRDETFGYGYEDSEAMLDIVKLLHRAYMIDRDALKNLLELPAESFGESKNLFKCSAKKFIKCLQKLKTPENLIGFIKAHSKHELQFINLELISDLDLEFVNESLEENDNGYSFPG